jgi:hypothetical protein
MPIADLFSYAESFFQSLVKNPPEADWAVILWGSFDYGVFVPLFSPQEKTGRLEYSPPQIKHVGRYDFVAGASFSGDIPAAISLSGDLSDISYETVTVTVTAPTFISGPNYTIDFEIQGYPSESASVTDGPPAVGVPSPGIVQIDPGGWNLRLWGSPALYPPIIKKVAG